MPFLTLYNEPTVYVVPHDYTRYQRQLARQQQRRAYDAFHNLARHQAHLFRVFDDLFNSPVTRSPAVELREEGNEYVLEAELPGVRKEDLEVKIGEGGKSVTIEGKVFKRSSETEKESAPSAPAAEDAAPQQSTDAPTPSTEAEPAKDEAAAPAGTSPKQSTAAPAATEPVATYSSSFSRTFQLPKPVDGARVTARLEHGVLSLRIPQIEDPKSVRVNIE